MAVKFLDFTGLQKFWEKCKNAFVAKASNGDVYIRGQLYLDTSDDRAYTMLSCERNAAGISKLYAEDGLMVNNDVDLLGDSKIFFRRSSDTGGYLALTEDGWLAFDGDKLALADDVPDGSNFVGIYSDDTISGDKTFTEKVNVTGSLTIKNVAVATVNDVTAAVANAGHLKREKVDVLPGVATAKENVIYMVPNSTTGNNKFDEYMLIDGAWEKTGSSDIDLSGYANTAITEAEINSLT